MIVCRSAGIKRVCGGGVGVCVGDGVGVSDPGTRKRPLSYHSSLYPRKRESGDGGGVAGFSIASL